MTFLLSNAFSIIFIQFLSIAANYLAYNGIYLAISPPVNTGSNAVHNFYTLIHISKVSDTSENSLILISTSTLNGATYL